MRKQEVRHKALQLLKDGEKPSVQRLSEETGYPVQDIHRCLNALEKEGSLRTFSREVMGNKIRFISV